MIRVSENNRMASFRIYGCTLDAECVRELHSVLNTLCSHRTVTEIGSDLADVAGIDLQCLFDGYEQFCSTPCLSAENERAPVARADKGQAGPSSAIG